MNSGTRVPLTSKALIDEQEFLELVDQLRVAVPDEVRHAKRVSQERDRVISQAQSDADKMLNSAVERAELLVQESDITRSARQRATALLSQAVEETRRMRAEADQYAMEVLEGLESELNRLVATAKKGKAALEKLSREDERLDRDPLLSSPSRPSRGDGNDTSGT